MRWFSTCLVFVSCLPSFASDWPRFRGPDGTAVSTDDKVPTEWSDQKNHKWRLELPGKGFSSPIVVGQRVFVTCYSSADGLKRHLVCVDRHKGSQLWSKTVASTQQAEGGSGRGGGRGGMHGHATSTPVSDGERIYVLFGTTGVLAFDMDGKELWRQNVGTDRRSTFGSASSPIVYKDWVIVLAGSESENIYALDRKTGKVAWKENAGSLSGSYSTPSIVANKDGVDEMLVMVTGEVWGMNPLNGKLKWYASASIDTNACTSLVVEDGIAYAVGGRSGGRTAIRIGGRDDVSKQNVVWNERGGSYVGSPVLYQGHLYWVDQGGQAKCINAKTGKEVERTRLNGNFYASLVVIKDKLYAVSRDRGTYVLEANPKMKELAHNKLSDDGDFSASPAVSKGQLFLRSDKYLHCIAAD